MKKLFIILFFIFNILNFRVTFAQNIGVNSGVSIEMSPENPKVGESFEARLVSYSADLDRSNIVWTIDNKVLKAGFAVKNISGVLGQGSKFLIARVTTPDGREYVATAPLFERSTTMVYEGLDSYVPDWYEGKKQVASGGTVRVLALPTIDDGNGNYLKKEDMVFNWFVNGEPLDDKSGAGKYFIDLVAAEEYGKTFEVKVTVKAVKSSFETSQTLNISVVDPDVLLYENNSIYGESHRAILGGMNILKNSTFEIFAEPFYFSVDSLKLNNIKYLWSINGASQLNNTFARAFKIGDKSGASEISIAVKHLKNIMQEASRSITLSF